MSVRASKMKSGRWTLVITCFLILFIVLALTGHKPHFYEFLPYALILACPLLHLLMHKNHGHSHNDRVHPENEQLKR